VKKSIIWATAGLAIIGFGVPAYAAISSAHPRPTIAPASAVVVNSPDATTPSTHDSVSIPAVGTAAVQPSITVDDNSHGRHGGGGGGGGYYGSSRSTVAGTGYYGAGGDG
jgi:hypothetical protein